MFPHPLQALHQIFYQIIPDLLQPEKIFEYFLFLPQSLGSNHEDLLLEFRWLKPLRFHCH